jgi:hypothetical protein
VKKALSSAVSRAALALRPSWRAGPCLLEVMENRPRGGERHRVAHKGAREPRHVGGRLAVVAVFPEPAVERVEVARAACDDADGQPAARDLAVSRDVGADAEEVLRPLRMAAEAGHDLVEHERDAELLGQATERLDVFDRLEVRVAAAHGLHEDERDLVGLFADDVEGIGVAVVEDDGVLHGLARDAGRGGKGPQPAALARAAHLHLVEDAVVVAVELGDLGLAGDGARHADGGEHGFRPGVAEGHALHPRELAHELGHFAREDGLRADGERAVGLFADRVHDDVGLVAEEGHAVAADEVDVFVAVHVPDPRALRAVREDRVDHLLPAQPEALHGARIGEDAAGRLRRGLGLGRAAHGFGDERVDVALLDGREPARAACVGLDDGKRDVRCGGRLAGGRGGRRGRRGRGLLRRLGGARFGPRGQEPVDVRGELVDRGDLVDQLARGQLDLEGLLERRVGLREEEGVEAQLEKGGVDVHRVERQAAQPVDFGLEALHDAAAPVGGHRCGGRILNLG